jgi:CheY-like chemotaxis protein
MATVLLIDDEPGILEAGAHILAHEGYGVLCASNGVEAFKLLARSLPDLIITDWMMPHMDGATFCRLLKSHERLAHIPVIVHTAAPMVVQKGHPWDSWLRKPAPMKLFLTTVSKMCNRAGGQKNNRPLLPDCPLLHFSRTSAKLHAVYPYSIPAP